MRRKIFAAPGLIAAPGDIWFNEVMAKDWLEWHRHYDNPDSSISLRLAIVQRDLRRALAEAPRGEGGVIHLVSMCAGEGRDVLPVLAEEGGRGVRAVLIEYDEATSERARAAAAGLGLSGVEVLTADAGTTDTYLGLPPAHVMLVCSVFGNIEAADMRRTVATLPALMADGGIAIWTRSQQRPSQEVRECFLEHGFDEMSFTSTADGMFRVGMNRLAERPGGLRPPPTPGARMFSYF